MIVSDASDGRAISWIVTVARVIVSAVKHATPANDAATAAVGAHVQFQAADIEAACVSWLVAPVVQCKIMVA